MFSIKQILNEYNKRLLNYEPTPKQLLYHNAGAESFQRLFSAGNGVGKTTALRQEVAIHATGYYPNWWKGAKFEGDINFWLLSQDYQLVRDNLQIPLLGDEYKKGIIDKSLILEKKTKSQPANSVDYVIIKRKCGGLCSLYFKSYAQLRGGLQGVRVDLVAIDEEPPFDIYLELIARTTSRPNPKIFIASTPLKGVTEFTEFFFKTKDEATTPEVVYPIEEGGKFLMLAGWNDNPFITESQKTLFRSTIPQHELEAREKGIPCIGSGLVFQVHESQFIINDFAIPDFWDRVYGLDVGFKDPTAVVFCAIDRASDILYITGEYIANELTAQQHANVLLNLGCDWIPGVCDPAVKQASQRDGKSLLDDYQKAGLSFNLAKYSKEYAVDSILERIRTGRFKVFNSCRRFLQEWRMYARDKKGKIQDGNDHLMTALQFVITDGLHIARTRNARMFDYEKPRFF